MRFDFIRYNKQNDLLKHRVLDPNVQLEQNGGRFYAPDRK